MLTFGKVVLGDTTYELEASNLKLVDDFCQKWAVTRQREGEAVEKRTNYDPAKPPKRGADSVPSMPEGAEPVSRRRSEA